MYLVTALFLVITIDTLGIGFVWPLFGPLFTGDNTTLFSQAVSIEWRNILYGITIGIANLATFLCSPILGDLSDSIGRSKILFFCLISTSIGMIISALGITFNQVILIIFSRAWLGVTAGSQVIAQAIIIDTSNHKNKSAQMGIISAANNIGFVFGPIIGSLLINKTLVSWFNLTTPFYFAAILAILGALFLLKVFKKNGEPPIFLKPQSTKKVSIFIRAFTHKKIRNIALVYICLQIGWALYLQTNFLSLIQKYHYSSLNLAYFLSWLGVIFCFNLLVIVRILTHLVPIKIITFYTLTTAMISCLVMAFHNTTISIWLGTLTMATATALGSNAILTNLSNDAQKYEQGWIMGIGNSLAALAWAITPPITGILLVFGFTLPLIIAGFLFLLGLLLTLR
ncbi:MAG: MFS transporter [Coxiellaceae bacterium]|jgi:MFS family permease|nr:MFS transporter [Coxiellaceae bacterium]